MARRPPPRIKPTEAQLRAAYATQHWRHRHTFDQAMADESLRRVLRMLAVQAARVALRRQAIQACQAVRTRVLPTPTHAPTFDRKRAAAGEREDD
jgi:hypothetical protein